MMLMDNSVNNWSAVQHSVKSNANWWFILEYNEKETLNINMPLYSMPLYAIV